MPLISPVRFERLFKPLKNYKTGFVQLPGNHGDSMIRLATLQMFELFDCDFREIGLDEVENVRLHSPVDRIVIGGGGSLGKTYGWNYELRQKILGLSVPTIVFPQTVVDDAEDLTRYQKLFARERITARMSEGFKLFPDLALGLTWDTAPVHSEAMGVFLRNDWERALPEYVDSIGDPAELCRTVDEYIALAGRYKFIVTDRVHFGIAGLMQGSQVVLLPGAYFKNRALYDAWLESLGCSWADSLLEVQRVTS